MVSVAKNIALRTYLRYSRLIRFKSHLDQIFPILLELVLDKAVAMKKQPIAKEIDGEKGGKSKTPLQQEHQQIE